MSNIHIVLQGKGGVGKSFIASMLFQYFQEKGFAVSGFDTDPVNASFAAYKEFAITPLPMLTGDTIDQRKYDELIGPILAAGPEQYMVIDNGASTFLPLCSYFKENDVIAILQEAGHHVFLHTVMTGGSGVSDTANGIAALASSFSTVPLVVGSTIFLARLRAAPARPSRSLPCTKNIKTFSAPL